MDGNTDQPRGAAVAAVSGAWEAEVLVILTNERF